MRALTAGLMTAGLAGLGLFVVLAGRAVAPDAASMSASTNTKSEISGPPLPADVEPLETSLQTHSQPARAVGEDLVAQPPVKNEALARAEPRAPLSSLGQALPPPKPDITLFYRPVATASAEFESMGYKLAIAGIESIGPDKMCKHKGTDWACGVRARTAVRLWLRGRALSCKLPPETRDEVVTVGCRLGKDDVGAWLVSNGWARAVAGGPYVEAEAKARQGRPGIFGPPPSVTN